MTPTCEQCTCGGIGRCPVCRRILAVVAAEARPAPPARRRPPVWPALTGTLVRLLRAGKGQR